MPVTFSAGVGVGEPGNASVRRVIACQVLDVPLTPGSSRASTKLMLAAGSPTSGWPASLVRRTSTTGRPSSGTSAVTMEAVMDCAELTGTPPPDGGGPGGPLGPVGPPEPSLGLSPEQAASASAAQASSGTHRALGRTSCRALSNVMTRTPILVAAGRPGGRPARGRYSAWAAAVSAARPAPWQTMQDSLEVDGVSVLPPTASNTPPFCRMWALAESPSWQVPQVPAVAESQVSSVTLNSFAPGSLLIASAPSRAV